MRKVSSRGHCSRNKMCLHAAGLAALMATLPCSEAEATPVVWGYLGPGGAMDLEQYNGSLVLGGEAGVQIHPLMGAHLIGQVGRTFAPDEPEDGRSLYATGLGLVFLIDLLPGLVPTFNVDGLVGWSPTTEHVLGGVRVGLGLERMLHDGFSVGLGFGYTVLSSVQSSGVPVVTQLGLQLRFGLRSTSTRTMDPE